MNDKTRITSSAGVSMPRIIYGTAWKKERTSELVTRAVRAGFSGIDTACQPKHYNEPQVGAALKILAGEGFKRESLYLQTKFTPLDGQDPEQIPYDQNASIAQQVAQSFKTSQHNLQTDYMDCLILHSPYPTQEQTMQAWQALENIQREGGARQLGISNCYDVQVFQSLLEQTEIKPAILQNRFYKDTEYDKELRRLCEQHDVIYESFWTLTANPELLKDELIQTLSEKYQKTQAQVFFRYLTQRGIVPLTGTCSEQHMREDLDIFDFELSAEELGEVSALL